MWLNLLMELTFAIWATWGKNEGIKTLYIIRVFWLVIIIRHPDCWYHFISEAENSNSNSNLPVLYVELYSTKKLWDFLTPTIFYNLKQIKVSRWDMKSKFLTPAFLNKIVNYPLSLNAWHEYSSHAILVLTYLSCMVKKLLDINFFSICLICLETQILLQTYMFEL